MKFIIIHNQYVLNVLLYPNDLNELQCPNLDRMKDPYPSMIDRETISFYYSQVTESHWREMQYN